MRILLLGGSGQLGQEFLSNKTANNYKVFSPSSSELDISNFSKVKKFISNLKPDLVLNFAAYTDVDAAENNFSDCLRINFESIKNIINLLNKLNIPLIHISTDYVFGRYQEGPYDLCDKVGAVNNYGISKLKAEEEIIKFSKKAIIIRTASLYGKYGNNFAKTFLSLLVKEKKINVVSDQNISITWSKDIINAIFSLLNLINKSNEWKKEEGTEIIHLVNKGYTTWYNIALNFAEFLHKLDEKDKIYSVEPILAKNWKIKTPRPTDSRLVFCGNIPLLGNVDMPEWNKSLNEALPLIMERNYNVG